MRKEKTPSERLLKKYFDIKSINEFETALADIPQSRFDFLANQISVTNPKVDLRMQMAHTIQHVKTGKTSKQLPVVTYVLKNLFSKIDSDADVLRDAKSMFSSMSSFSSGAYFVSDATRELLKENREDRKAVRQMVEILFDGVSPASYLQNMNDLLFYHAKIGDAVCVVNDQNCNFDFDSVMNIFFTGDTQNEKFIHLKKSKIIISERDKYILYREDCSAKLEYILKKLSHSTDKDWVRQIPTLLNGDNNSPSTPPVPNNRISPQ